MPGYCFFSSAFFATSHLACSGEKIGIGIAEQGLGRGNQFGIVVARANGFAEIGRRGHGVDVGIVGETGVGVMIEGGNLFDLREQALVDLLNVGSGEGAGLGGAQGCEPMAAAAWRRSL